ncbi:MAG TPA: hypothetical protein VKZ79_19600 [Alphaproteobacteria bacterium]|nr:hypothetical protein [Alphaproteobacteria bacterium]
MASRGALPVLCFAVLAVVRPGSALADEAGCLVVGAWDEARGEPAPVIEAVVSTIVNRARARGISVCDAVMDPAALTGVTPAMHEVFSEAATPHGSATPQPHTEHDRSQLAAVEAAARAAIAGTLTDRSNGATHFYSPSGMRELGLEAAPRWAASMVETAKVGPFVFLRERGLPQPPQSRVAALEPELAPVPAPKRPQEPVEPESAAPEAATVDAAAIEPSTFAPLPPARLQSLPIRPAAPPVEIAAAVLDPGSYLDISKAGTGPHFSIVGEASAAELSTEPEPKPDQPSGDEIASALPPAPTPTARMPQAPTPLLPPAPAPPRHSREVQNDWAQPESPQRSWAPIQPAAEYIPPPPRIPAFGYFSPESGTWLYCRGWGTRAILVQAHGRRLWQPRPSGVRCGM